MCLAVPGEIMELQGEIWERTGKIRFGGVIKHINLAFVPEAQIGDFVLVHAGVAISIIQEREAGRVFEYLEQLNELAEIKNQ